MGCQLGMSGLYLLHRSLTAGVGGGWCPTDVGEDLRALSCHSPALTPRIPLSSPGSIGNMRWKMPGGERDLKGGRNRTADGHVGPAKDGEKSRALGWQRNTPKNGFHMLREEY